MKKFLNIIAGLFFAALVLTCLFFIFKTPILNLIQKTKDNLGNVTVEFYVMNPDTEEFTRTSKKVNVKEGSSYTYVPEKKQYYVVDTSNSVLSASNVTKETVFTVYYVCEKCTITFELNGGECSEPLTYEINKGHSFFAPNITKEGYKITSYTNYVDKIYQDTTFIPQFSIAHYNITLVLADGCEISDDNFTQIEDTSNYYTTMTYLDEITLPSVSSSYYYFRYWEIDGVAVTKLENVTSDLTVKGVFNVKMYTISFVEENGKYYAPMMYKYNEDINPPKEEPTDVVPGYGMVWYLNNDYTNQFSFTRMPSNDLVLYGRMEYDTGCGFLTYDITKSTIDSLEDFTNCIDYVYYNYITSNFTKEITYCTFDEVNDEFKKASDLAEYRSNTAISIGTTSQTDFNGTKIIVDLKVENNTKVYETSVTAPENITHPYNYVGYDLTQNLRPATFNDFYIESIPYTYNVETTNQLLYVVEHGYKPICTGKALSIYNKAKQVLRNIVNDDMSDFEKLEHIYEYLCLNVQYDYNALHGDRSWAYYDAYFMEGVFNNQKAVCDGIAKSLVLLCNIEGIPCVEVSGNNHAWCEVKIKNMWYVIDATHGNLRIADTEYTLLDYSEFLISKDIKQEKGYASNEFKHIDCNHLFDYFEYKEFTYGTKTISLVVSDYRDLEKVLEYITSTETTLHNFSINFKVKTETDLNTLIELAKNEYYLKKHHSFNYALSWSYDNSLSYKICKLILQ